MSACPNNRYLVFRISSLGWFLVVPLNGIFPWFEVTAMKLNGYGMHMFNSNVHVYIIGYFRINSCYGIYVLHLV